ncbi:M48 family metallopeptidase [Pseudomonas sp. 1928-m]|uniref:M48 family metallopeptidase n=1 Tax=Pseudomonas sp. 1928-m TaxID=3033804 RepID=UPI0023DED8C8|nr:M48 family metallopeptidase [Pseudomonas sp. 1928-m]MDF3195670.1 M48 family metallopeptidase [Pseudomonas sp. 1928-m]
MNFFEQQDRARRNSGRLLILMALAVLSLITLTSLVLGLVWQLFGQSHSSLWLASDAPNSVLPSWPLVGCVALVVIGVVLLGSLYKQLQLSRGGQAIAERLGGRLINLSPQNLEERRLLNVVEEMALASGTSVPPVYVLDDAGINAFAAGLTPQDAVIGITRGAICQLSRDELQGVIAHEFSHIFHGDMRLNTRLVSVLHGILLLGLIGGFLLRSSGRSGRSSRNNSVAIVLAIGVTLWVLGYAGTFFGNLIKAAVSRQREFLADASAVQYTRNPDSIAGALKKIGGNLYGSQLQAGHAAEFSHMYFAAGISQALEGMLATHPPLDQRIRRITPSWDGRYPHVAELSAATPVAAASDSTVNLYDLSAFVPGLSAAAASEAIGAIGDPQAAHLLAARSSLAQLDLALSEAAHSCSGAQALLYGLLLDPVETQAVQQLQLLQPRIAAEVATQLEQLREPLRQLAPGMRLSLLDLAMPALKQLAADQFAALKANLALLIRADGRVALLEWTLLRIVERNVEGARAQTSRYQLQELAAETRVVLSLLARAGGVDEPAAQLAFQHAGSELAFPLEQLLPASASGLAALEPALRRLSLLWPLQKPQLLKAMARCIEHDGQINPAEAELMRAVADILDCPMPPLLATRG